MKQENNSVRPDYYNKKPGGVECISALKSCMTDEAFAGFCKGNIIKYIWRYEEKGGADDLRKALQYLTWLIEVASDLVVAEEKEEKKEETVKTEEEDLSEFYRRYL